MSPIALLRGRMQTLHESMLISTPNLGNHLELGSGLYMRAGVGAFICRSSRPKEEPPCSDKRPSRSRGAAGLRRGKTKSSFPGQATISQDLRDLAFGLIAAPRLQGANMKELAVVGTVGEPPA